MRAHPHPPPIRRYALAVGVFVVFLPIYLARGQYTDRFYSDSYTNP